MVRKRRRSKSAVVNPDNDSNSTPTKKPRSEPTEKNEIVAVSANEDETPQNNNMNQATTQDAVDSGTVEVAPLDPRDRATDGVLTKRRFDELSLTENTLSGLSDMGFECMTEVQARCIPHGMRGRDILGAAKTGSGKTLAFLVPIVELLTKVKWKERQGTGAIVISPTRELAMQIFNVLKELTAHHSFKTGLVIGGVDRRQDVDMLEKGVAILVATPGRLLDHLHMTDKFLVKNCQVLVIDEADRCLEVGFEEQMHQIVKSLPRKRQTMLFSATQTTKVEELVRVSFRNTPLYVDVRDKRTESTVAGLEQGFVIIPIEHRFLLLYTFLRLNRKRKIIVFMSSCNAVKFYYELLNHVDIPVFDLHGRQKQNKRTTTFHKFCNAEHATLISTDVAARGLDIPAVDWIIQFDPPDDPKEYIHRVGRTARGVDGKGKALLFLLPSEVSFLAHLKREKIPLNEYEFPQKKLARVQPQLDKIIATNYMLNKSAKDGYRSYLQSYASHSMKDVFNVHELDLNAVARSFCFEDPPRVNLNLMGSSKGARRKEGGRGKPDRLREAIRKQGTGHKFSASNPQGQRDDGDSRQFVK